MTKVLFRTRVRHEHAAHGLHSWQAACGSGECSAISSGISLLGDDGAQVRQSCVQAVRMCDTAGAHVSGLGALFNFQARTELHIVSTPGTFLHRARLSTWIAPHVGRNPYQSSPR